MKKLLIWAVNKLPSFTIAKDGLAYLTRYYVFLKDRAFGNIFIHHFHRSDMDMGANGLGLLHNHPFPGLSFIISGGYKEERRFRDIVYTRVIKPFSFNWISASDYHRVDLLDEEKGAWSIFITGRRFETNGNPAWGFWDRTTKEHIPFNQVPGAIE